MKLDLTQQWVQELVERELRLGRVEAVHMGPPCGTASKARNIPIRKKLRRAGAPNPQPLRSSKFPEGFPWLKGIRKAKVASANVLYEFAAKIANICDQCQCGILFTIENPQNSLIWETFFLRPWLSASIYMLWMLVSMVPCTKGHSIFGQFRCASLAKEYVAAVTMYTKTGKCSA